MKGKAPGGMDCLFSGAEDGGLNMGSKGRVDASLNVGSKGRAREGEWSVDGRWYAGGKGGHYTKGKGGYAWYADCCGKGGYMDGSGELSPAGLVGKGWKGGYASSDRGHLEAANSFWDKSRKPGGRKGSGKAAHREGQVGRFLVAAQILTSTPNLDHASVPNYVGA